MAEMPNATLAMFSTLKYVNAPNFEHFRKEWKAEYLGGFIVHSKAFDALKGNFPIGFMIWDLTGKQSSSIINTIVLNRDGKLIGEKRFFTALNSQLLSEWLPRTPKSNVDAIPLINAVTPTTKTEHVRNTKWSNGAIAHFFLQWK